MEDIDEIFKEYTEPEKYNEVIKNQYKFLDEGGYWLEHPKHIKRFTDLF